MLRGFAWRTAAAALLVAGAAHAQSLTLPPSGDNQPAEVKQWIGPIELSISYHSPDVTSPTGQDRRGKIWGDLVKLSGATIE